MTNKIESTEKTWNPSIGCTKISQGCKNCYAEKMAERLKTMGVTDYKNGFNLTILESRLESPLHRKKPTTYFVNSMSDLFHEEIPFLFIDQVFKTIEKAYWHTFRVLTKRAQRMAEYFSSKTAPANAWLGVTVEDRASGMPRIDYLRNIQASVRFLSVEPLLEELGEINLKDIDWVIVGGESGANARPMNSKWVELIQEQCEKQRSAFFFKQWGEYGPNGQKKDTKLNQRLFKGRTWDEMPNQLQL